ncbi:phytoene desaturase family protein [Pseudonocardia sp. HH130630-07]|uniref:phytoene desaturase family protein n=1 Tax=Pseudonocardia sp. HH130630-07 TaxID=1690815 RepID=UPI0008153A59|nr:NAD(P)/FAD-dependent oxidoreductase [Pseudonocardia sp. HH130630-07]ANY06119.1 FAD-dependent oxidoreductase [Pseudonocardia sp. HH130630-07]
MAVDAVVAGSGPNGLAAAITLARAGLRVRVYEAADTPGGGLRSTHADGWTHDVCSTVQALALVSPFFRTLDLDALGVRMRHPRIAFAHPLDGGRAAVAHRSVARTAAGLGADGPAWERLLGPLADAGPALWPEVLGNLRRVPRHPLTLARFGLPGLLGVRALARTALRTDEARALFAGAGAHALRRLDAPLSSAFGLALVASAHAVGWPVVEGGSGMLAGALVRELERLGGEVETGHRVSTLAELPARRLTLLDVTPAQLLRMAEFPAGYARSLAAHRYGPGVCKVDYELSGPVPWTNPDCRDAGTLHLGGTLDEIARSEADAEAGRHPDAPYVLAVQAGVADPTRAPAGKHTLWTYCHVPHGSDRDMSPAIDRQVERFAPGFRDLVERRIVRTASDYHQYNENYVGGAINGGMAGPWSAVLGPVPRWSRYATPLDGVYLCSASTAPGGGVHGMAGYLAASEALAGLGATPAPPG